MEMAAAKTRPLPEGVTSVDEFIRPTHEPTLHGTLSVRQPVHELGQVQGVRATAQNRRGESAEGVPSVRLRAGLAGDAALVRLAPGGRIRAPRGERRVRQTGEMRDGERGVTPPRVRLAAFVHAIATVASSWHA